MRTELLKTVTAKDGYFGDTCTLWLCYDPDTKITLAVTKVGYFRTEIHLAADAEEALWLVNNHPRYKTLQLI